MRDKRFVGFFLLIGAMAAGLYSGEKVLAYESGQGRAPQGEMRAMRNGGGMDQRPGGKMPTVSGEAKDACDDKEEKAECSFTGKEFGSDAETTISGVCMKIPSKEGSNSSEMACMPERKAGGAGEKLKIGTSLEMAEKMKNNKADEISRIESRMEKIISFLESEGIDVSTIDGYFKTFKTKATALLDKYDEYITLLEDDEDDSDKIKEAREAIRTAARSMAEYFSGTLRESIKTALDSLKDNE